LRIELVCIGRLGEAPEARLARDYAARATAMGRQLGLGPVEIVELEARGGGKTAEGAAIIKRLAGTVFVALDEQGASIGSREFGRRLERRRDDGTGRLAFVIGGPDGLAEEVLARAAERLAFGVQTWPHALARVMLAEQIYRAATILAGTPYHRD
jgi:23S rRNA (pseudouridine1915-N3)-methyltransferase